LLRFVAPVSQHITACSSSGLSAWLYMCGGPVGMAASAGGWVSKPSEPSVAGMLLLSGLGGLVVARPPLWGAALGLAVLLLHIFTFDPAFNAVRRRDWRRFAVLASVNAAPYLASTAAGIMPAWVLAVAGGLLAGHSLLFARRGPRDPLVYIVGAAVPVLPALALPALAGAVNKYQLLFWLLLTGHSVATAAYVETRLPWRRLNPLLPAVLWAPFAAAGVLAEPVTAVALAEPTVKVIRNLFDRNRVIEPRPEAVKRLGWRELYRLLAFTVLLAASLLYASRA